MKKVAKKSMAYKTGGVVFKPCAACKTPAACKKAGKCLAKEAKKK
jgi:hypothetical protein